MTHNKNGLIFGAARDTGFQLFNTRSRHQLIPLDEKPPLSESLCNDLCTLQGPYIGACCYAAKDNIA